MLAMLVMAIPCVGPIMLIVWAFAGDNESRKNYFRAILLWILIFVAIAVMLAILGQWPHIQKQIQNLMHNA